MRLTLICKLVGHKFGEWEYVSDMLCEQVRVCIRDGYKERRPMPHQFGEWEYVSDTLCEQVRVCIRDGYKERRSMPHQFNEWKNIDNNSCEQMRVCQNCSQIQTRTLHQWGTWENDGDNAHIRLCNKDKAVERIEHKYEEALITCNFCNGHGSYEHETMGGYGNNPIVSNSTVTCTQCDGTGEVRELRRIPCIACDWK